jgi:hypothetical protein
MNQRFLQKSRESIGRSGGRAFRQAEVGVIQVRICVPRPQGCSLADRRRVSGLPGGPSTSKSHFMASKSLAACSHKHLAAQRLYVLRINRHGLDR